MKRRRTKTRKSMPSRKPEAPPERTSAARATAEAATRTAVMPFTLAGRMIGRAIQIVFALFVVVLHPQIVWLIETIGQSALVQDYIKPAFRGVIERVYEPYIALLKRLPPYWATFSIALPLAILEPAKFAATIMIALQPKIGVALWLLLQAVGFVLIERTWAAVRPQSRKVWLVARTHAFVWLNVAYGKHWIKTSALYLAAVRWKEEGRKILRAFFARLAPRRGV
jgi:hypothetical protein